MKSIVKIPKFKKKWIIIILMYINDIFGDTPFT